MAKQEKLITFEKGMTASPYSDVSPDGELELLNNLEVHAGSIKPAAFMGNTEEAERIDYDFSKEGFTLRFIHTTGSIKHLLLSQNGTNDVYYYEAKSRSSEPKRIEGFKWGDKEDMEAVALGNLIVISCSEKDDRYLLWRRGEYKFTLGSMEGEELQIVDDETLKDIKLRFGIHSTMTQFVKLGNEEISTHHYANTQITPDPIRMDIVCCAPKQEDSASISGDLAGLMASLKSKCESNNQFMLPFFVRYVVYKNNAVLKVSPPVLVTPTTGCPLLVVDFTNTNDEWGDKFNYDGKFHYGVVGTCTDLNASNINKNVSNLCVSVVGDEDLEVGELIDKIEVYVTPPLVLYDFKKGYKLENIPYPFLGQTFISWVNGKTTGYVTKSWLEDGLRHDFVSGKTVADNSAQTIRSRVIANQKDEWLLQLQELMLNAANNLRCKMFPFDPTRDYIARPAVRDDISKIIDNALLDGNFKLYKVYDFSEGDKLGEVIRGSHGGRIVNPINDYGDISSVVDTLPEAITPENTLTTGGHLFRYNSRLFKYGYTQKSGNANYTCDEMQQVSGARMQVSVAVDAVGEWSHYDKNPISHNSGFTPLFVIPMDDGETSWCANIPNINSFATQGTSRGEMFGYVWYKDTIEGKTYVGKINAGASENIQAYGVLGVPFYFFSYPRHGCTKAIVYQKTIQGDVETWRKIELPMKSSEFGNFSYWCMYGQDVTSVEVLEGEPSRDSLPEASTEEVSELNRVAVSEAYNPYDSGFVDPEETIGAGKVLALAVQKAAISTGQFGTHPIIAFCSDGNYALSINEEGKIGNVDPMEGPLLTNRNSLVTTHKGVYYMSKNGLCLLSGNQHRILSRTLEGKAPSNIKETRKTRANIVVQTQEMDARNVRDDTLTLEGDDLAAYALEKEITLQDATIGDIMKCIPHFVPTKGEKVLFWRWEIDDEGVTYYVEDNNFNEVFAGAWMYHSGESGASRFVVVEGIEKTGSPQRYHAPEYVRTESGIQDDTTITGELQLNGLVHNKTVGGLTERYYIRQASVGEKDGGVGINKDYTDTNLIVNGALEPNDNHSWWQSSISTQISMDAIRLHWSQGETERVLQVRVRTKQPSGLRNDGTVVYKQVTEQECAITLVKDSQSSKVTISKVVVRTRNWNKMQMPTCCVIKGCQYKLSSDIYDTVSRFDTDANVKIYNKAGDEVWSGTPSELDVRSEDYNPYVFTAEETDPLYYFDYKIEGVTLTASDKAVVVFTLETTIGEYQLESRYGLVQSSNEVLDTRFVTFTKTERCPQVVAMLNTGRIGSVYTLQLGSEVLDYLPGNTTVQVRDDAGNTQTTTIGALCEGCDITSGEGPGQEAVLATLVFPAGIKPLVDEETADVSYTLTLKTLGGQDWEPPYGQSDDPEIAEQEAAEIAAEQEPKAGTLQIMLSPEEKSSGIALKKNELYDIVVDTSMPVVLMVGSNSFIISEANQHVMTEQVANASWENVKVRVCPIMIEQSEQTMLDDERSQRAIELPEGDIPEDFYCAVRLTSFKAVWKETSYMKILSDPLMQAVYDEMGQRIFYGVPGARTFVVFNVETETFSMMTADYPLRAVINEHPYTYIQFEDYSLMRLDGRMDYIDEKQGGYDGYIVSRPFKMDSFDLKKISEISLVGNFREAQELTIQGSNSIQKVNEGEEDNWVTLGTTTRSRVPHIVGRWFKYWRVIMKTHLHETENITGIRVKFEVRGDGRLR